MKSRESLIRPLNLAELDGEFPDNSSEADSLGALDFPGLDEEGYMPDPDFASPQMVVMRFRELFERHDIQERNFLDRKQWKSILAELFPHVSKEEGDYIFDKSSGNGAQPDVIDYQKILMQMRDDADDDPDCNPDVLLHKFLSKYFHMDDGPLSAEGALLAQIEELERWKREIGQPAVEAVRELEFDIQELEAMKNHIIGDLETKIDAIEEKNRALIDANRRVEMELIEAEESLKNKEGGINKLLSEQDDLENKLESQTSDLTNMSAFLEMRHNNMEEQRIQIRRLEAEVRQLERLNQELTHDIGDLNSQLHFSNERAKNADLRCKELKTQYQNDKDRIRKELTETKTKMRELQFEQSQMEMDEVYFGGVDRRRSSIASNNKRRMSLMSARDSLFGMGNRGLVRQNSRASVQYYNVSEISPVPSAIDQHTMMELIEADESDSEDYRERVKLLEEEEQQLRTKIKQLEAELSEKVQKETEVQGLLSSEIEKFRKKQLAINAEADAQIAKEKQALESKYQTKIAELNMKLEQERTKHSDVMTSERTKFEEMILKERTKGESNVEKERVKYDEQVTKLEAKNRAAVEKMKAQREQDLQTQRTEHEAALQKERETVAENIEKNKAAEIERWKQWLDDANNELNTYFMQVKTLKQEKDAMDTENSRLKEASTEQQQNEERLKADLQDHKDRLRKEAETQTELRRKLDYMNSEKIGLQNELEILETQRGKLQRKVSDLELDHEETRATLRRRLSTANEQRQSKEQNLQQLQERVLFLQRELEQKTSNSLVLQTKLDNLRTQYEKQEEEFILTQAQLQNVETDLSKMKSAHAVLDKTHSHESSLFVETKSQLVELEHERDQLQFTKENLQRQLDKTREEKETLLLEVTNQSHTIQKQTTEIRLLTKATEDMENLKSEQVEARKEHATLLKQNKDQDLEIIRVKGELDANKEELKKSQEQLLKAQSEREETKAQLNEVREDLKKVKLEGTAQKMQLLELSHDKETQVLENKKLLARIERLNLVEAERDDLDKKVHSLETSIKEVKDEAQSQSKEILELKHTLDTKDLKLRQLEEINEKLQGEVNEKKEVLVQHSAEIQTRSRKLTQTLEQSEQLARSLSSRDRELVRIKSDMILLEDQASKHELGLDAQKQMNEELKKANEDLLRAKEQIQEKVTELEITNNQQATELKLLQKLTQDVGVLREKKAELQAERAKLLSQKREADLKVIELSHANDRKDMELSKLRDKLELIEKDHEEKHTELMSHRKELDSHREEKRQIRRQHTMTLENEQLLKKSLQEKENSVEELELQIDKLEAQNEKLKLASLEFEMQSAEQVLNLEKAQKAQLDLKQNLLEVKQNLKDKSIEVIDLQHELEAKDKLLSKLESEKSQSESEKNFIRMKSEESIELKEKHQSEARELSRQVKELKVEVEDLEHDVELKEKQLAKFRKMKSETETSIAGLEDTVATQEQEIQELRAADENSKEETKSQLKEKIMQIQDLTHDVHMKDRQIKKLKAEVDHLHEEGEEERVKLRASKKDARELKSSLDSLQHEYAIQEDELHNTTNSLEKAEENYEALKRKLEEAKREYESKMLAKEKEEAQLVQKIEALESRTTTLSSQASEKEEEILTSRQQCDTLRASLDESRGNVQRLENTIISLRTQVATITTSLENKLRQLEEDNENLKTTHQESETKRRNLVEKLSVLKMQHAENLNQQKMTSDSTIENLQAQLETIRALKEKSESELQSELESLKSLKEESEAVLKAEVEELTRISLEKEAEILQVEEKLQILSDEHGERGEKISKLEEELANSEKVRPHADIEAIFNQFTTHDFERMLPIIDFDIEAKRESIPQFISFSKFRNNLFPSLPHDLSLKLFCSLEKGCFVAREMLLEAISVCQHFDHHHQSFTSVYEKAPDIDTLFRNPNEKLGIPGAQKMIGDFRSAMDLQIRDTDKAVLFVQDLTRNELISVLHHCPIRLWQRLHDFDAFELLVHSLEQRDQKHTTIDELLDVLHSLGVDTSKGELVAGLPNIDSPFDWRHALSLVQLRVRDRRAPPYNDAEILYMKIKEKCQRPIRIDRRSVDFKARHRKSVNETWFQLNPRQNEITSYAKYINCVFSKDPTSLPNFSTIETGDLSLLDAISSGIILAGLINLVNPDTIDFRVLNMPASDGYLTQAMQLENHKVNIDAARFVGVKVKQIEARDFVAGGDDTNVVLDFVGQLILLSIVSNINVRKYPELMRLLRPREKSNALLGLNPKTLLVRWLNYHLVQAGSKQKIHDIARDIADGTALVRVMHQLDSEACPLTPISVPSVSDRLRMVIENAVHLGIDVLITPKDLETGCEPLCILFVAYLFIAKNGLMPMSKSEIDELWKQLGLLEENTEGTREERSLRVWINSLEIPGVHINNLFEQLKTGIVLLKILQVLSPNSVDWGLVRKRPKNKFQKMINANYVISVCESIGIRMLGIDGGAIVNAVPKLVLSICWKLMRYYTENFSGMKEDQILDWANKKVSRLRKPTISNFADKQLSSGIFLVNLLAAVEPRIIHWDLVSNGMNRKEKLMNARYILSSARRLGASIFLLPEDIAEMRSSAKTKIMAFCAALMKVDRQMFIE